MQRPFSGRGRIMATVLGNVAVCAVVTACAGFSAPYATAAPFRTQVTHEEELFRLSDQRTGKVLIETDDTSFHYYLSRRRASLEPQVEIVPFGTLPRTDYKTKLVDYSDAAD